MKIYMVSNKVYAMYFLKKENAEANLGKTAASAMKLTEIQLLDTPVED